MTVFLSLSLMLILSLLLTLAEGVHFIGLQADTRLVSRSSVENVMAEYSRELWKNYGILGLDMGYGDDADNPDELEQRMLFSAQTNAEQNLYEMEVSGCALSFYRLLTDDGGAGFIREAADAQRTKMGEDMAQDLVGQYAGSDQQSDQFDIGSMLENGEKAILQSGQDQGNLQEGDVRSALTVPDEISVGNPPEKIPEAPAENPIDQVVSFRQKSVLTQIIPSDIKLSAKSLNGFQPLENRNISTGTITDRLDLKESERILFRYYLLNHFETYKPPSNASAGNETSTKILSYEMEYILCGRNSDTKNLEGICVRLLALRETENFAALLSDTAKMAELEGTAWAIAGITANPLIVKAVKAGLMAAWAYLESVLDVRLLLTGGKVPLVKDPTQWTSSITEFPSYLDAHVTARDCGRGLSYASCFMLLMMLSSPKKLAFRAMDLMEGNIRLKEGYGNMRMDHMICEVRSHFAYEAKPLFLKWITIGDLPEEGYNWQREEDASYL